MDLGLGNLDTVRKYVLPATMQQDTQWDSVIAAIALGVARRLESYCNRKFGRFENDVAQFNSNRSMYILPRYPIETITSLSLRATSTDPWQDVSELILQEDVFDGMLYFGTFIAESIVMMRAIYTGGWFYETLEPTDEGYPTAQPGGAYDPVENEDGSFALLDPRFGAADLQQAWLMQILHEFELKDRLLPTGLANEKRKAANWRLEETQLLPEVQSVVNAYRRFQVV